MANENNGKDAPKADMSKMMQAFGIELEKQFPDHGHILLVIEPYDEARGGGQARYISNTSPDDVRTLLRELLEQFDAPHAENAKDVTGE